MPLPPAWFTVPMVCSGPLVCCCAQLVLPGVCLCSHGYGQLAIGWLGLDAGCLLFFLCLFAGFPLVRQLVAEASASTLPRHHASTLALSWVSAGLQLAALASSLPFWQARSSVSVHMLGLLPQYVVALYVVALAGMQG